MSVDSMDPEVPPGGVGAGEAPGPAGVPAEIPEEALREAREEAALYRDRWMRAAADLENFRKLMLREREEWALRRTAEMFEGILRVRDDFERALAHVENPSDPLVAGVQLVYRHLVDFCERHGVQPVEALGQPFDPELHDAILQVERKDVAPNTVVDVAVSGYRMGERVLRHAQVVVSKASADGGGHE